MFKMWKKSAIEQLRAMSSHLNADFYEGIGAARLELDNKNGKGFIFAYELLPGLSVRTYNIRLKSEQTFQIEGEVNNPLYLLYCVGGHYFHKFKDDDHSAERISRGQNVILSATEGNPNMIRLPSDVDLKISVIILRKQDIDSQKIMARTNLRKILEDIFARVGNQQAYRYFGGISADIEKFSKVLINNKRTDVVGKLLTEGAALNTLAAQLDQHDKNFNKDSEPNSLSKDELERIVNASDVISKNLHRTHTLDSISKETGLSSRKLQEGFRLLYGESVAVFVKNLKLERARELIQTTDLNISEVVHEIGIQSKSYFSKIFKEKFGMVPRDYRESFLQADQSFELSYRSKASFYIGEAEVNDIVDTSDRNNKDVGVTGCLVHYKDEFFQLLEGPKRQVLKIYEKIKEDQRHKDVELLWRGARKDRIFEKWGLLLVSDKIKQRSTASRDLGIDMRAMLYEGNKSSATTSIFWQQIRNRLRSSKEVST